MCTISRIFSRGPYPDPRFKGRGRGPQGREGGSEGKTGRKERGRKAKENGDRPLTIFGLEVALIDGSPFVQCQSICRCGQLSCGQLS